MPRARRETRRPLPVVAPIRPVPRARMLAVFPIFPVLSSRFPSTHVGELAATAAVSALLSVFGGGDGARALPPAFPEGQDGRWGEVKALAGRLDGENWRTLREEFNAESRRG